MDKTVIHLTEQEALLFVEFQKRYTFIKAMESLGVFDVKSGSVQIHFTALGEIAGVDIHQHFKV